MKKTLIISGLLILIIIAGVYTKRKYYDPKQKLGKAKEEIKSGDIIFQTSLSGQSKANAAKAGVVFSALYQLTKVNCNETDNQIQYCICFINCSLL